MFYSSLYYQYLTHDVKINEEGTKCLHPSTCLPKLAFSLSLSWQESGNFLPQLTLCATCIISFNYHKFLRLTILQVIRWRLRKGEVNSCHYTVKSKGEIWTQVYAYPEPVASPFSYATCQIAGFVNMETVLSFAFIPMTSSLTILSHLMKSFFPLSQSGEITFINYPTALT